MRVAEGEVSALTDVLVLYIMLYIRWWMRRGEHAYSEEDQAVYEWQ